ncbi:MULTISPECIES: type II toxin-antitoxin system death-on-curing family toxin [Haloarcula]|uniref:Fido domain-containing protein n=1 Tax=Haloarcula pellucida TaxID=1427151 RepID=A0A830GIT9_9EURY|nr:MULTISPECIES: type II toxin-antitoxin system death-on-curing family toxin [Halomicroarcula]MBX0348752.1 type II toxin-antitoxin system death-on-curing family toxin [Halomicroarcula pellucida]MDS0278520.1 type II toxin-antitoxin system death-on-curing family toxin [Halomicroarcula sp. S1AR25-4]GGN91942.1 hypothetical protein GCM10009030_15570 [Halomicroarcula pellucida]
MSQSLWYPSVDDVLEIHEDILAEYADTSPGVQNEGDIQFALDYIEQGHFGSVPETIHEKAFHLCRLLVANHPFVDGNKRTALNTTVVFYFLNGYEFDYDEEIREILKRLGTNEADVDEDTVVEYLQTHTKEIDLEEAIARWRNDLVEYGLDRLSDEPRDPND